MRMNFINQSRIFSPLGEQGAGASVLVTGGTGLLGTHLILALHEAGVKPRALYRSRVPDVVKDKAEWVQGDILDVVLLEELMQNIQQVYHVAGMVSFSPGDEQQLRQVNVEGTANVVNACLQAGVQKLVHVSSVSALGRVRPGQSINETMWWTAETSNSEYGRSKYLGEMEVWRGVGEGLNAVVVNPSIILGEHGDWNTGSTKFFKTVYKGFPWYSTGVTGFVDANDTALAMIALMNSDITAQRFVINAKNLVYRDLFYMIADSFGVKRPSKQVSPFMAALVWRLARVQSFFTRTKPFITKETAHTSLMEAHFDSSKLLQALPGFAYRPILETVQRISLHLKEKELGQQ